MGTAIYTRVSTPEQVEKFGLTDQREQCFAMAKVKGWEVTHEFSDDGVTGTRKGEDEREAWNQLMETIEAGEINAVIFPEVNRLGRTALLVLEIVERLEKSGVEFVSCKEQFDTSTPAGKFVMQMFAALAELDRNNIVERTTAGRDARGRVDGEKGGREPLGYARSDDGIVIVPDEAAIVRQVFEMRQSGAILQKIADVLNEQEVTSKQGGKWYPSTVRQILLAEDKYRGGLRGYSPVYWPAILDG